MRVAFLTHPVSAGGISRVLRRFTEAFAQGNTDVEITLFCGSALAERDGLAALAEESSNLEVRHLEDYGVREMTAAASAGPVVPGRFMMRLRSVLKRSDTITALYVKARERGAEESKPWYMFELTPQLKAALASYDLLYLVSPSFIEPFDVGIPVVCTINDFNWKHEFRGNYNREMKWVLDRQIGRWMGLYAGVATISQFTLDELHEFYPGTGFPTEVIRLPEFGTPRLAGERLVAIRDELGLPEHYVAFPGAMARHKNVANLLRAWELMRATRGVPAPLVLTGVGSDTLGRERRESGLTPDSALYEVLEVIETSGLTLGDDIRALGYVTNEQIDGLIQGADLVISPSLYEGAAGPALDAWSAGTPVALSAIPTFLEYMRFLGTQAWTFDPTDPASIADAVRAALGDPETSRTMAVASREAMGRYGWADVSRAYRRLFDRVLAAR